MAKRLIPLLNRVVIQRMEIPKTSTGGIILPDTNSDDTRVGKVVVTGKGEIYDNGEFRETLVKEGQFVLLPSYPGQEIEVDKEKFHIYRDTEILGVLD